MVMSGNEEAAEDIVSRILRVRFGSDFWIMEAGLDNTS